MTQVHKGSEGQSSLCVVDARSLEFGNSVEDGILYTF